MGVSSYKILKERIVSKITIHKELDMLRDEMKTEKAKDQR